MPAPFWTFLSAWSVGELLPLFDLIQVGMRFFARTGQMAWSIFLLTSHFSPSLSLMGHFSPPFFSPQEP